MKGKKHRPEQIIRKLREAEMMLAAGKTIGQVAQALSSSAQTFSRTTPMASLQSSTFVAPSG